MSCLNLLSGAFDSSASDALNSEPLVSSTVNLLATGSLNAVIIVAGCEGCWKLSSSVTDVSSIWLLESLNSVGTGDNLVSNKIKV